jgi:hemerythrin-like metal-binding protein
MKIDWNDNYKIGDETIDAEHQHLFELINKLLLAEELGTFKLIVMQLYKHTREHFESEEALMRKLKFPDCAAHTENHNQMLKRLNELSAVIGKGVVDKSAIQALMTDWALRHVPQDDGLLADYVKNQSGSD